MSEAVQPDLFMRLDRIATGLEAEGYFGAAKLCRALGVSMLTRDSYEAGIPRASDRLDQELTGVIADLEQLGVDTAVVGALKVGQNAARENRPATWVEVPVTRVCRTCGELFLGEAPDYCPTCGSHALTFREILPIFYLEPLNPAQIIDSLASMPPALDQAIDGLNEAQLTTSPAPGEWSIRDVLWHLSVAQAMMTGRVGKMLKEDNPSLEAQATWAVEQSESLTTHQILARYQQKRRDTVALLNGLSFDQWLRSGRHTEFGPITLQQQMSYMAKHERYHLPQIAEIRRTVLKVKLRHDLD